MVARSQEVLGPNRFEGLGLCLAARPRGLRGLLVLALPGKGRRPTVVRLDQVRLVLGELLDESLHGVLVHVAIVRDLDVAELALKKHRSVSGVVEPGG
jgi:hypothetical protein